MEDKKCLLKSYLVILSKANSHSLPLHDFQLV